MKKDEPREKEEKRENIRECSIALQLNNSDTILE